MLTLVLAEFPRRRFSGKLARTSEAINMTTRTLLVEIDVANPTNSLLTGSFAEVHLKVPSESSTFLLPVDTLIFRSDKLQVGVVNDGKANLVDVTPGHDFGEEIDPNSAALELHCRSASDPRDALSVG